MAVPLASCRRQELSYECKATLFDQEVRMAENIDFQFPMKKACSQDIQVTRLFSQPRPWDCPCHWWAAWATSALRPCSHISSLCVCLDVIPAQRL